MCQIRHTPLARPGSASMRAESSMRCAMAATLGMSAPAANISRTWAAQLTALDMDRKGALHLIIYKKIGHDKHAHLYEIPTGMDDFICASCAQQKASALQSEHPLASM